MLKKLSAALMAIALVLPAAAWGPKTQLAISTTALYLVSKEGNIPLTKMGDAVRQGAMESQLALIELYPDMLTGPIQAIESEMLLLKAVRGDKVDNYFAYRLGLLGKLVAQITAPMTEANPTYQNLYFTDVERAIETTEVTNRVRETVDPGAYFARCIAEANANNEVIQKEYESGVGIRGVAGSLLGADTSRSARAVADVWMTVLSEGAALGNISEEKIRDYCLRGMRFYVERKNTAALDAAEARYATYMTPTADYLVQLGDAYFEADMDDRAIQKYKAALALDPDRRDVVGRISEYFVAKGDAELEGDQLEAAMESYEAAVESNPLNASAEGNRLQAAKLIKERDERIASNQGLIAQAEQFSAQADEQALQGRNAEAIELFRQSEEVYLQVSDEFPMEASLRERGLSALRHRVQELKQQIMVNAADFSGTGYVYDVRQLVQLHGQGMDEAGLKAILKRSYDKEYTDLTRQMAEAMRIQ